MNVHDWTDAELLEDYEERVAIMADSDVPQPERRALGCYTPEQQARIMVEMERRKVAKTSAT